LLRCKNLETENACAKTNSATLLEDAFGVFKTGIPATPADLRSILSNPTPALAITFRLLPALMTSEVTFVALLTIKTS
jgi:hypothetical protein